MSKRSTLLFIGAHPDDETFGTGGTLAKYAAEGVNVYYACGTRGEVGSSNPEDTKEGSGFGDLRWAEMVAATNTLGLAGVMHLGYRDSGMAGTEDNKHPSALAAASVEEVTERIVKIIRDLKPEVVVTFDPIGGYYHPDHIAIHQATVAAFDAAADPEQFKGSGPAFQPQKLYYAVFSHRLMRMAVKILPLFGQDPKRFGRNHDVDLTAIAAVEFPVHAALKISKQHAETRDKAALYYVSQQEGGSPRRGVLGLVFKLFSLFSGNSDLFMRAYPPPGKKRETDLFAGVE